MLAEESGNLKVVLLRGGRLRTTLCIEIATGAFGSRGNPGSPCATCFNRAAGSCIIGHGRAWFVAVFGLRLTQVQTNIRSQALEESAGIARLLGVTILRRL